MRDTSIHSHYYIYVWQPAARGHRAYTDLSAARVRGPVLCTVCSLVNWEMTHMQPSEPKPPSYMDVEGPPFVNHPKFKEDLGDSAVCGCLRDGHSRRIWRNPEIPRANGGTRTSDLAVSNGLCLTAHSLTLTKGCIDACF